MVANSAGDSESTSEPTPEGGENVVPPKNNKDEDTSPATIGLKLFSIQFALPNTLSDEPESEEEIEESRNQSSAVVIGSTIEEIREWFLQTMRLISRHSAHAGQTAEIASLMDIASLFQFSGKLKKDGLGRDKAERVVDVKVQYSVEKEGDKEGREAFVFGIYDRMHYERCREFAADLDRSSRIVKEIALQQIVNAYERLVSHVITIHLQGNPQDIPKSRAIKYGEILSFSSLESAQRYCIAEEVSSVIRGKTTKQQIEYLKETLGVDLESAFKMHRMLKATVLKRHLVVHAAGIVTDEYIRKVKSYKQNGESVPEEGQVLPLTRKDIFEAWSVVFSAGVILVDLVARKSARAQNDETAVFDANAFLINGSYTAIRLGRYDAAEMILEYASGVHLGSATHRLPLTINYAQCLKWQGKEDECAKVLKTEEWRECALRYQLSAAALSDDFELFQRLMKSRPSDALEITIGELLEWPIFRSVRNHENFESLMVDVYDDSYTNYVKIGSPRIGITNIVEELKHLSNSTKNQNG